jgi:hypothetical protein
MKPTVGQLFYTSWGAEVTRLLMARWQPARGWILFLRTKKARYIIPQE